MSGCPPARWVYLLAFAGPPQLARRAGLLNFSGPSRQCVFLGTTLAGVLNCTGPPGAIALGGPVSHSGTDVGQNTETENGAKLATTLLSRSCNCGSEASSGCRYWTVTVPFSGSTAPASVSDTTALFGGLSSVTDTAVTARVTPFTVTPNRLTAGMPFAVDSISWSNWN